MFETVRNAFKIKDLRKKLFYTFFALIVVRIGSQLPVPGVKYEAIREMFNSQKSLDFFNQLTGGSFEQMSIFALNITPYITASIIIQLLTIAIPRLEELHKDGEEGRKKLTEYTRYVTIGLSVLESAAMAIGFGNSGYLTDDKITFTSVSVIIVSLTAGSAFLMWLGEQITEKGVGNGISIKTAKRYGESLREVYKGCDYSNKWFIGSCYNLSCLTWNGCIYHYSFRW